MTAVIGAFIGACVGGGAELWRQYNEKEGFSLSGFVGQTSKGLLSGALFGSGVGLVGMAASGAAANYAVNGATNLSYGRDFNRQAGSAVLEGGFEFLLDGVASNAAKLAFPHGVGPKVGLYKSATNALTGKAGPNSITALGQAAVDVGIKIGGGAMLKAATGAAAPHTQIGSQAGNSTFSSVKGFSITPVTASNTASKMLAVNKGNAISTGQIQTATSLGALKVISGSSKTPTTTGKSGSSGGFLSSVASFFGFGRR